MGRPTRILADLRKALRTNVRNGMISKSDAKRTISDIRRSRGNLKNAKMIYSVERIGNKILAASIENPGSKKQKTAVRIVKTK